MPSLPSPRSSPSSRTSPDASSSPAIYDNIIPPSQEELSSLEKPPLRRRALSPDRSRLTPLTGEPGYSVLERTWARPTLDVHGMPGGFTGAGAKTVIPAKAVAKVSMRLVPDKTPDEAFAQYKIYVQSRSAAASMSTSA